MQDRTGQGQRGVGGWLGGKEAAHETERCMRRQAMCDVEGLAACGCRKNLSGPH